MATENKLMDLEINNNLKNISTSEDIVPADVLKKLAKFEFQTIVQNSYEPTRINLEKEFEGFESSKFDKDMTAYDLGDINEFRAQKQSGVEKLGSGVVKGVGLASTTFLTAFTSLPYGIISAIGEGKFSNVYDNEISRAYDSFNKKMEEYFPNYYTNEEQNAGAFSPKNWFTMNFLSDKLLKNAGFTLGAIASGSIYAKGIQIAGKSAIQALGKITMGAQYADELAALTKMEQQLLSQGMSAEKAFTTALNQTAKGIKLNNAVTKWGATVIAAGSEGSIEALGTKQSTFKLMKDDLDAKFQSGSITKEDYDKGLETADSLSSSAGNLDFVANLAILTGSDMIQFGKYLSGRKTLRKEMIGEIERTGGKYAVKEANQFGKTLARIGAFTGGTLTESAEEGSQFVSQKTSEDFYSKKFNNNGQATVSDFISSVAYGFEQTFGSKEGLESMLLGGLTGFISGHVTGESRAKYNELKNKDILTRKLVDAANLKTEQIYEKNKPLIENATRSAVIQGEMMKAIEQNDIYQYKNLKEELFKSFVLSRIEMGKFDSLLDEIEDFKQLPQEEFEAAFGIDPTVEKKDRDKYIDLMKNEAIKLNDLKNNLDIRFPELSRGSREVLFDYASSIEHSTNRMDDISKELTGDIKGALDAYLTDKSDKNKDALNTIILQKSPDYEAKGLDLTEYTRDYAKLYDDKKAFIEKYREAITNPGKANLETKVANLEKEQIKRKDSLETAKFQDGSYIVDKETGNHVGILSKINGKFKLRTTDADGNTIVTDVDTSSKDFQDKYDVKFDKEGSGLMSYIRRSDGHEVSVTRTDKKGENGRTIYRVREGSKSTQMTEDALDDEYYYNPKNHETKLYVEKLTGAQKTTWVSNLESIKNTIKALKTTEARLQWLVDNNYVVPFTYAGKTSNYLKTVTGRVVVKVKIGNTIIPFYISTGQGGKTDVATNKWYVFFGQGKDGWFNKTSGKDINSQYDVKIFQDIATVLNEVGSNKDEYKGHQDSKGFTDIKWASSVEDQLQTVIDFITPVQPTMSGDDMKATPEQLTQLNKNIQAVKDRIKQELTVGAKPKTVTVIKDVNGNFKIKEAITLKSGKGYKYTSISKEELDNKYEFKKNYDTKLTKEETKINRIEALERLINKIESQITNLEEHIAAIEPLFFIQKEIEDLQSKLEKDDKRVTEASVNKIIKQIEKLNAEVIKRSEYVAKEEVRLKQLEKERDLVYDKLQRFQETDAVDLPAIKNEYANLNNEIKLNTDLISYFKKSLNALKKVINDIINTLFGVNLYNTAEEDKLVNAYIQAKYEWIGNNYGKEYPAEYEKAFSDSLEKLQANKEKLLSGYKYDKDRVTKLSKKVGSLQKQINKFTEQNDELTEQILLLEAENLEYRQVLREKALSKDAERIFNLPINVGNENTEAGGEISEDDLTKIYDSAARTLSTGLGLAGKHRIKGEGDKLNPDLSQQRYFRFTERINLNEGNHSVKFSYGESKETFGEHADPNDNIVIKAYIINKNGDYIDEFGNVTTDPTKYVYTTLHTSQATDLFFQPKDMSDEDYKAKLKLISDYHKKVRATIISVLDEGKTITVPITGKSKGIPRTSKQEFGENVYTALKDLGLDLDKVEVKVATSDKIVFASGDIATAKPGFVYAQDLSTGNIIPLTSRRLQPDEIEVVVGLVKMLIAQHGTSKSGVVNKGSSAIHFKDADGNLTLLKDNDGKPISLFEILKQFTFFTGRNLKAEIAEDINKETDPAKRRSRWKTALSKPANLINSNLFSKSAFHFGYSDSPGGALRLGNEREEDGVTEKINKETGKPYPIQVDMFLKDPETGVYAENLKLEGYLRNFLSTQFININSVTLNDKRGLIDITSVKQDKDGRYYVEYSDKYNTKDGYKQWLIDKGVLTSSIIPKQTGENAVPQFSSVYPIVDFTPIAGDKPNMDYTPKVEKKEKKSSNIGAPSEGANAEFMDAGRVTYYDEEALKEAFGYEERNEPETVKVLIKETKTVESTENPEDALLASILNDPKYTRVHVPESGPGSEPNWGSVTASKRGGLVADKLDDERFRKVVPSATKQMRVDKAIEWLNKTFGGRVKSVVVAKLIADGNWGSYHNSLITLYEKAGIGTEYHEAFHAVMDLFLNKNERNTLYKEYNKLNNTDYSDVKTEELLAEDFADFMLGKEIKYFKSAKQRSFFQTIIDFIKRFIYGNNIEEVFKNIQQGTYAEMPFANEHSGLISYKSSIGGLTNFETAELLDGLNAYFFKEIFSTDDNVSSLFDKSGNKEIVNKAYDVAKEKINNRYEDSLERFGADSNLTIKLKEGVDNFDGLVKLHKEYLKNYNLEFSDQWNDNVSEENRVKDSGQTWSFESLKYSTKINSNRNIKLLIGSLPLVYLDANNNTMAISNTLSLPQVVDYGKFFNSLLNKLSNLTEWEDMEKVLVELSNDLPSVKVLLNRLGYGKDISEMNTNEVSLRNQFQQTMAKNENIFEMDIVSKNGTTVINANQNSFSKRKIREWKYDALRIAKTSPYYTISNGIIRHNVKAIKALKTPASFDEALKILRDLGITFSNEAKIKQLRDPKILEKTNGLLGNIRKGDGTLIFNDEEGGNSYGDLNVLADIEKKTTVNNVENNVYNLEGDLVYGQSLNNYLSLVINALNNIGNTTLSSLPHLRGIRSSLVLNRMFENGEKKTGIPTIDLSIHFGSKQDAYDSNKDEHEKLKEGDKLRIRFNRTLQGSYNLLRPADNGQERFITFGKFFIANQTSQNEHLKAFVDYLSEELDQSFSAKGSLWNHLHTNHTHGIVLDMIASVDSDLHAALVKLIDDKASKDEFFQDAEKIELVKHALRTYIDNQIAENTMLLEDFLVIKKDALGYINNGINNNGKVSNKSTTLSESEVKGLVKDYTVNSLIANIEQIKLFFGNPSEFKNVEDEFKRHSGAVGTKKISIVSKYLNEWISTYLSRIPILKGNYLEEPEYKYGQPIIKTAVFKDIQVISEFVDSYKKIAGLDVTPYFGESKGEKFKVSMAESDGAGIIHLDEYRRMLVRSGDWTYGKGSLEEKYQYEKGAKVYTDPHSGQTFDIELKRIQNIVFTPLKPQHFGPLAESDFHLGFYKLSLFPLTPSMAKQFPNLQRLNDLMINQKIGIVTFASANKVGTKLVSGHKLQELYDDKGNFLLNKDSKVMTQDTFYKYWGIQVDMGNQSHNKVIWGTQMLKQFMNNLFDGGTAKLGMRFYLNGKTLDADTIVKKALELNAERIKLGYEELIDKLGLKETDEGYEIDNPAELINNLKEECIRRQMPNNIIDSVDQIATTGIDTLPNREKFEYILMALADKTAISQKTFGTSAVQVPSTFLEKSGIRKMKNISGKEHMVSNDLKFYDPIFDEDGKIVSVKSMEVYLSSKYKGVKNIKDITDPRLLKLMGFRIPTSGLNMIESVIIKGFLPDSAGDSIVVPSELVAKSGSDFDIDTLKMLFPNVYYDKRNNPRYITRGEQAWDSYQQNAILNEEDEDKLLTWREWSKKAVENELTEVMHSIVTSPDNALQLLTANTSKPLEDEATYIKYLQYKRDTGSNMTLASYKSLVADTKAQTPYNKIVETRYLMDVERRFLGGKAAIGVTALYSTFHILAQQNGLFINKEYQIMDKVGNDRKLVSKPTTINMEHRTNNDGNISIGHTEDTKGDSIVDVLGMWITAAVDAAKNPFMFDLNVNQQTLNTVLYLHLAGVSRRMISLFMNQPIIIDYIRNQNKYESLMLDAVVPYKEKMWKDGIIAETTKRYGGVKNMPEGIEETHTLKETELIEGIVNENANPMTQLQVLYDFLRYQDTAKFIGDAMQGINYDTKAGGKTISEMSYRLALTQKVVDDNVVGNYQKLIDDSFITPYHSTIVKFRQAIKEYVPHLRNANAVRVFNHFMSRYLQPHVNFKKQDVIDAMDKFKQDFISYLIMTSNKKELANQVDRLFKGENNMASRTVAMQKDFPKNTLLQNLMPIFAQNTEGINNIKMYISKLDTIESNQLTEDWEQLFEQGSKDYAEDLIKFIILQSGLQNSPINFITLVPVKYYSQIVNRMLIELNKTDNTFSDFIPQFMVTNKHDKTITPRSPIEGFEMFYDRESDTLKDTITKNALVVTNAPVRDFKANSSLLTYGLMDIKGLTAINRTGDKTSKTVTGSLEDWKEEDNISQIPFCNK